MNMNDQDRAVALTLSAKDHGVSATEIERLLEAVRSELADADAVGAEIAADIPPPHWSDTRETDFKRNDAKADLFLLTNGVGYGDGVSNRRLAARAGRPGLAELQRLESKLVNLRERALQREQLTWPRPFRYTGKPGRAVVNGRHLEPGDVVELTEARATAWADRFTEVADDAAV